MISETVTFGHPTFQAAGKTFAVLEEYNGELGIALKVGKLMQGVSLKDPRFFMTPYAGKHGWVTLRVQAAPLNSQEIRGLLDGSYHLVPAKNRSAVRMLMNLSSACQAITTYRNRQGCQNT